MDHFHPPLRGARHWESFHSRWAVAISDALNGNLLPRDYFAEPHVHVGSLVEVDVGTFEDRVAAVGIREALAGGNGGTAMATLPAEVWAPPAPEMVMPAVFPDSVEVLVYQTEAGPTLVAAVELISPGNKDRDEIREGFAAKCATYLQQGVGLMIVDIVTERRANLHNKLVQLLNVGENYEIPDDTLYAVAYRPVRRPNAEQIEVWPAALAVDQPLPLLPLALDKGLCVPLDLGATYTEACQHSRLP